MVPTGIGFYLFETQNIIHLVGIAGGGIGLFLILYGLLQATNGFIKKRGLLQITDKEIRLSLNQQKNTLPLEGVKSVIINQMPSIINLKITKKNEEVLNFALPGNIISKHEDNFRAVLESSNIEVQ